MRFAVFWHNRKLLITCWLFRHLLSRFLHLWFLFVVTLLMDTSKVRHQLSEQKCTIRESFHKRLMLLLDKTNAGSEGKKIVFPSLYRKNGGRNLLTVIAVQEKAENWSKSADTQNPRWFFSQKGVEMWRSCSSYFGGKTATSTSLFFYPRSNCESPAFRRMILLLKWKCGVQRSGGVSSRWITGRWVKFLSWVRRVVVLEQRVLCCTLLRSKGRIPGGAEPPSCSAACRKPCRREVEPFRLWCVGKAMLGGGGNVSPVLPKDSPVT